VSGKLFPEVSCSEKLRPRIPASKSDNAASLSSDSRKRETLGVEKFLSHLNYLVGQIREVDPHPRGKYYGTISIFNRDEKAGRWNELSLSESRTNSPKFLQMQLSDIIRGWT